jgi:hypothetical protein
METKNYICNGNAFAYSKGYIGLPVVVERLPETLTIKGETLQLKSSFHVSLVCVKNILEQLPDAEQEIIDEFCRFSKENEVSFGNYTGEFRFVEDGDRKTLVALCEISNLTHFADQLSKRLDIEIPCQPTHVTLYTLQPDVGIGLNSLQEMQQKSYQVEIPDSVSKTIVC